ncbi:MAG: MFS transporter [Candidatus Thorarchaeota archaeon]
MSSWLIRSNPQIRTLFLGFITIFLSLGCIRFLFPFQILNLGGNTVLISVASAIFSVGQVVGFLLIGLIFSCNRTRFLLGGIFLLLLTGFISFSTIPIVLTIARGFEGIGYGFLFLCIISIAAQFPDHEGEALGALFASVFIGLAIGQGIAGFFWRSLVEITYFSSTQAIQIISFIAFALILISMNLLRNSFRGGEKKEDQARKWNHFHLDQWFKMLSRVPPIALLLVIYSLYDLAHGLYTPNLSILLNQQGINEIGLSLGYFIGDITWGVSQVFAGRLVDRIGHPLPLILSLLLKGVVVIFYPYVGITILLFVVLFFAGLAEGFLEPARNKAALSVEMQQDYIHSHLHLDLGFSSSGGFVLGTHKHEHRHETQSESLVGALQSIGILFFGFGSIFGSWLLLLGFSLKAVTFIGGLCLALASITSILFSLALRKK